MGSLAIFRALLVYIQGEAHPLYVAERRLAPPRQPLNGNLRFGIGCIFLILFFASAISTVLGFGRSAVSNDIATLTPVVLLVGWLVSLGWVVPAGAYAGSAISRERAAHTWDLLCTAPYTTEVILLAKSAASICGVWSAVVAIFLSITFIRIVVIGTLVILAAAAGHFSLLFGLLLLPVIIVVITIEGVQEIVLSVLIGVFVGLNSTSPRLTILFGAAGAFMLRLTQIAIVWWLMSHLVSVVPSTVTLASTIGGSTILLPGIPGIASLLLVLLLAVGREGLVRILLAWTLRLAHEG